MNLKQSRYSSGAPLEDVVGYSRAMSIGPFIFVGGTTSVLPDGSVYGEEDSYAQMKYILEKQISFVEKAGGTKEDVFSVKCFVTDEYDEKEGAKAYSEIFKEIKPLFTVIKIESLNRQTQLVEVQMNAIEGCSKGTKWEGIDLSKENFFSGLPTEKKIGYSQMVKIGPFIYFGGMSAIKSDGSIIGENDSTAQDNYIFEKMTSLLKQAGATPADVIKIEKYMSADYKKYRILDKENFYTTILKPVKPLLTGVTIAGFSKKEQLIETEIMAVEGCGGKEKLSSWGNLDLRRKNYSSGSPLEDKIGYSRMVTTGPFVYVGGTTSVLPDGSVYGEEDSRSQDNFIFEKEVSLLAKVGAKVEDIVKIDAYRAPKYKEFLKKDVVNYYEKMLKPIKPLLTGLTISALNRPTQMNEIEMLAIKSPK